MIAYTILKNNKKVLCQPSIEGNSHLNIRVRVKLSGGLDKIEADRPSSTVKRRARSVTGLGGECWQGRKTKSDSVIYGGRDFGGFYV